MAILKVKKNGVWEKLGVFSVGVAEPEIFIVTVNIDSMTSSYSPAEIKEAYENGKLVVSRVESDAAPVGNGFVNLSSVNDTEAIFASTHVGNKYEVSTTFMVIQSDKSVLVDETKCAPIPAPTESDYGKVLTSTASGLAWVTAE